MSGMDGGKKSENSRFWSILAIFGPLEPPWDPLGAPTPHLGSVAYYPLKYLQNETNPRLVAQSI